MLLYQDTKGFLSLDPVRGDISDSITMNGYKYASNNSVINVDPDREWVRLIIPVIRAGAMAA
ncbi:MAG: hypothetical protein R3250_15440 [Melioribacteraceae bacterium]|nr:hypothetical protein [Melioribacteraceae bacterium]